MQLSILIPTHRHDLLACSRIVQACTWAGPRVEVIVRDNSGNAQKRELLARLQRDHCNIVTVDPCTSLENFSETLRLAKGEFVYLIADDDFCFDRAIAALPDMIDRAGDEPSIVGVTGTFALEASKGSSIASYQDVESDDVAARVAGYLKYPGPNVLVYSPVRRELTERIFAFRNTMPFALSFHDQIACLLYLLNGKFLRLQRFLYLYDFGVWESPETAQRVDADYYVAAGFDPAVNMLHWFLCGFEGAVLIRNADIFPDYPLAQRQPVADRWFSAMFQRFKGQPRLTFGSRFSGDAQKLRAKLQASTGQMSFHGMLSELSTFMALFSKKGAQDYFDFWDAVLNKRKAGARAVDVAGVPSAGAG